MMPQCIAINVAPLLVVVGVLVLVATPPLHFCFALCSMHFALCSMFYVLGSCGNGGASLSRA